MPNYIPKHPRAYSLAPEDFEPEFLRAWRQNDPAAWRGVVHELFPRVFGLKVLSEPTCLRLDEEIAHREAWSARNGEILEPPNGMHEYGVILDKIGFEPLLKQLMERWLAPLAAELYPEFGGDQLDQHHGFLAEYVRGQDEDLGFHVDDSEVTLNLCLGQQFHGSELYFAGLRCADHMQTRPLPSEHFDYDHEPGMALLHAGKQRHGVEQLRSGRRRNLILWCRNSQLRANPVAGCPDWCGEN